MNKVKILIKNSLLFALGNFGSRILIFLLVPLYTRYMTTAEYGMADILQNTINLFVPILSIDIALAVFRFSMQKEVDTDEVVSIAFYQNILSSIVFAGCCLIGYYVPIFSDIKNYIWLLPIVYMTQSLRTSFQEFCRGIENIRDYAVDSILYSIILFISTYIFIVYLDMGIIGFLQSLNVSSIVSILFLSYSCKIFRKIKKPSNLTRNLMREMYSYAIPLVPNDVSWWITNLAGRYLLIYFYTASLSGIYSVAYKIPSIMSVLVGIFMRAWEMMSVSDFENNEKDLSFYVKTYDMLIACVTLIGAVLIAFSFYICSFLYASDFVSSWKYMPFLIVAMCIGCYQSFLGSFYLALKRTDKSVRTTLIGAFVNLLSSVLLIYLFGAYGPGIAMILSYYVIFMLRTKDALELYQFQVPIRKITSVIILLIMMSLIVINVPSQLMVLQLSTLLILILCYINRYSLIYMYKLIVTVIFKRS